jgi:hypothetical protein
MNIFVLDKEPELAAQYHCDRHVLKMILETAQILSTVVRRQGIDYGYQSTHENHPCVQWAGICVGNFLWLQKLGRALCAEYTYRYRKTHASECVIRDAPLPPAISPILNMTPFPQCMPEVYREEDTVQAYRDYYMGEKTHLLQYTYRHPPEWMLRLGFGEHR